MNLSIDSHIDNICHLSLSGKISQIVVDSCQDQLIQLVGQAHFNQTILLSLQNTNSIDSSGIGWLLATDKRIRDAGGTLVLHSLPHDIQCIFQMMRLNSILKLAKDKQSAEAIVNKDTGNG